MIVVRDIRFYSLCEHHIIPFFGVAHVGYIPGQRLVGLSKIARVVDYFARSLQIQERLTQDITDYLYKILEPVGLGVVLEAEHLCMSMRGIRKPGHKTITDILRGAFLENASARAEFFNRIGV